MINESAGQFVRTRSPGCTWHPEGVRIGAVYPQTELSGDPEAVRTIGDALEGLGYDHLVAYDHVLGAEHARRDPPLDGPYTERDPFHDPFVLFSYLAGRTTTLEFATGILVLPQRQTALVAKQAADLAVLSGDRLRLGVGTGWNWVEYEALGADFEHRGALMDEQVELLRALWARDLVDHDGDFHRVDRAGISPRPSEPPEIWMGGSSKPPLRRAARVGDGFFFGGSREKVAEQWLFLQEELRRRGRSVESFGAQRSILARKGPEDAAQQVRAWADLGGTHASIVSMFQGLDSAEAHLDYLGQVADSLDL